VLQIREVTVGLLGCGVVGSALAELIHAEEKEIAASAGVKLNITKALVRDTEKDRNGLKKKLSFTKELEEVFKDKELDVVVELLGGEETALAAVKKGLEAGRNVVTANKLILSAHGEELNQLANRNGCSLAYEASVASCIPVLQSLDVTLAAENFHAVTGILNGTTNFILSQMERGNLPYGEALALAQQKGLAETDPSLDVSGQDAAHKLVILARKAFNISLTPADIPTAGITNVSAEDLRFAAHFGCTVKLLAVARKRNGKLEARVAPHLVPTGHTFASINDESNAVVLEGEAVGKLLFAGPGAGALPTARAVLGDILSIVTGERACIPGRKALNLAKIPLASPEETRSRYYLRVAFNDQPHVLAQVTCILDACGVEVHRVEALGLGQGNIVILTHPATEAAVSASLAELAELDFLTERPKAFPIFDEPQSN
jgi:homoserine dehydrogenase